jgi:hypothetical protein
MYSGAECLAQRDNTGQTRWQLRQTFSVSLRPAGVAQAAVANILAHRSELPWPSCSAPEGLGGFIQLVELNREDDTLRTGFARFAADGPTAVADGLCFVGDSYDDPPWALPELYAPPSGWPSGLPPPASLPWALRPSVAYRYSEDFDVASERQTILSRFDPETGDLYGSFDGIFYLNELTGYLHAYGFVTYIVNYESASAYNAIPIREAEMKMQLNDPLHPNCAGSFLGDNPDLPASCSGDATNRAWGCPPGSCGPGELAPVLVEGYFLIAELEQIYNTLLSQTLCNFFPGASYPDWETSGTCRSDAARWNPLDPDNGLPPGDWCATTNSEATPTCHDAWKSVSYAAFQAFPIREGTCTAR